jgi:hypothetical protein
VVMLILQTPDELIEMAYKYYADTALPKLVSFLIIDISFLNPKMFRC